ncbi:MAG TPA: hypothetical protein PK640_09365 [Verrucomicrobiota bacterium]|nr:hypothetical protein [Verrucomicrobiota bacterium]
MTESPCLNLETIQLAYDGRKAGRLSKWVTTAFRGKVPGGWLLVSCGNDGLSGIAFYPDPKHEWDGGSLG